MVGSTPKYNQKMTNKTNRLLQFFSHAEGSVLEQIHYNPFGLKQGLYRGTILLFFLFIFSCATKTKDLVEHTFTSEINKSKNDRKLYYNDFIQNSVVLTNSICIELHRYNFQYGNYNKEDFIDYTKRSNFKLYDALINNNYVFIIEDTLIQNYPRENIWISTNEDLLNGKSNNLPYYQMNSKNFDKYNFYFGSCDDGKELFNFPIEFFNGHVRQDVKSLERWRAIYKDVIDEFGVLTLHSKIYKDGSYDVWNQKNLNGEDVEKILRKVKNRFPEYRNYEYAIFKIDKRW